MEEPALGEHRVELGTPTGLEKILEDNFWELGFARQCLESDDIHLNSAAIRFLEAFEHDKEVLKAFLPIIWKLENEGFEDKEVATTSLYLLSVTMWAHPELIDVSQLLKFQARGVPDTRIYQRRLLGLARYDTGTWRWKDAVEAFEEWLLLQSPKRAS